MPSLRVTGNVLRRLDCFHPLVVIPQIYPSRVTFAKGCTVFQLSTSERLPLPRYQQWRNLDAYIIFKHTRQGAQRSDRRFALVHYSSAYFLVTSGELYFKPKNTDGLKKVLQLIWDQLPQASISKAFKKTRRACVKDGMNN